MSGTAAELAALAAAARAQHPELGLDERGFLAALTAAPEPPLPEHAADLFLAVAALEGLPAAQSRLRERCEQAAAQVSASALEAEDAAQDLMATLLTDVRGAPAALRGYRGRGRLDGWLKTVARGLVADRRRREQPEREVPLDPSEAEALGGVLLAADPLLLGLKEHWRVAFKEAFQAAMAQLTPRQLGLLRFQYLDKVTDDAVAAFYRVDRRTILRWRAAIREALFSGTRTLLAQRMDLPSDELSSLLSLVQSQLEVSLERLLRAASGAP